MDEANEVRVDVGYPLAGPPVPMDHGYVLFGAVASIVGDLHGAKWLAIHPLRGTPLPGGRLGLVQRKPALILRVAPAEIPRVLPLAGRTLTLAGLELHVGGSMVQAIQPYPSLTAHMVVIKGFTEPGPFAEALDRQLTGMNVKCEVEIGRRRVVSVAGDRVIGFGVHLRGLDDVSSVRVQHRGLGGRQRMGCGVFVPLRGLKRG